MAETSGSPHAGIRAVVRPLSRAAGRPCARPGCPSPSQATLRFRYGTREAWLAALSPERTPEAYDLCSHHADRTRPPHGWQLVDDRPRSDDPGADDGELGGEHTVAVLAAALRGAPDDHDGHDDHGSADHDPLREALEELQAVAVGGGGPDGDDDRDPDPDRGPDEDPVPGLWLLGPSSPALPLDVDERDLPDPAAEVDDASEQVDPVPPVPHDATDAVDPDSPAPRRATPRPGTPTSGPGRPVPAARERDPGHGTATLW